MLRSRVKHAAARVASWIGVDEVARARRDVPFVVCYHRVVERLGAGDGYALPAMEISVATFEKHLDWMARNFRIVSLDEFPTEIENPRPSLPLAAITFDDGYRDIYDFAFPLLKRKGIPAGMFVVTDLVNSGEIPMHERVHTLVVGASRQWNSFGAGFTDLLQNAGIDAPENVPPNAFSATRLLLGDFSRSRLLSVIRELERTTTVADSVRAALRPLTWEQITEMRDAGMTIGSHTRSHSFLTNESVESVFEELEGSRKELTKRLGSKSRYFAYPDGRFNPTIVDAVAAAGYRYAFTICRHRDPLNPMLTIPRTGLWERSCLDADGRFSPSIMSCQSAGLFSSFSNCAHNEAITN